MTDEQREEQKIIKQALQGDDQAFEWIIVRYQNLVYSVALRTLDDENSAADISQESFMKAFAALGSYRGGKFRSWLMQIVVNNCYDVLRKRKRRKVSSLDEIPTDESTPDSLIDSQETPHEYAERMELHEVLEYGLQSISPDQRIPLILYDIHGYSYDEVAEIVNIPIGTVKSRISRSRAKLRDYLLQYPELLPSIFRYESR